MNDGVSLSRWVHGGDAESHVSLRRKKPAHDVGSSAEQAKTGELGLPVLGRALCNYVGFEC